MYVGRRRADGKRTSSRASRVAWELANGPIPDGLLVCHKCDNPACVNVEHLFLGTHKDNMEDMVRKGRWNVGGKQRGSKGEKHGQAKLTDAQVMEIRRLYAFGGITCKELAVRYGIVQGIVSAIVNHKTWRHLPKIEKVYGWKQIRRKPCQSI
jgi:hypothetical protein